MIHEGWCQMPAPCRNEVPKRPISAMLAAMKHEYVASNAQPAKKPARGPRVAPASAYAEPAWLKKRVSRTKEYEMRPIAIAANRKASGTARPTSPAGATPFNAIAAVGAMIPTEIAIASQKRSSRRSTPCARCSWTTASLTISLSFEDRQRDEAAHDPVRRVDYLVDAQVASDARDRVRLLALQAVAPAEVRDRRSHGVAGGLQQVRTDAGADVVPTGCVLVGPLAARRQRELWSVEGQVASDRGSDGDVHRA